MSDWYTEWVELHCRATGADPAAALALTSGPVREYFAGVRATPAELGACTARLAARPPKWANEHAESVAAELVKLRSAAVAVRRDEPPAECADCGGSGWVCAPHPACWHAGELACYPGTRGVVTVAVTCRCHSGQSQERAERERSSCAKPTTPVPPRRWTLDEYLTRVNADDPIGQFRDYQRRQAEEARRVVGKIIWPNLADGIGRAV